MFQKFKEAGLVVIPENNGVPLKGVEWSKYTLDNIPDFSNRTCEGYGLICGEVSNIIALDIDTDDPAIIAQIEGLSGLSPIKKRGGKGFTSFFKYNGEQNKVWKKDGEIVAELLSTKRKTTIPPSSYKKTGRFYEYIIGDLLDKSIELPCIDERFIELMDIIYPSPKRERVTYENVSFEEKIELAEAEEMLSYISPDCSYDEWKSIGAALAHEFGDAAFGIWDKWSSTSSKYDATTMQNNWRGCRSYDNYTIATLCYYAQEAGYIKAIEPVKLDDYDIDISYLEKIEKKEIEVHGLVGEIAQWITETAIRPQPQLALGAALTFVGMLKGHAFETTTGLRSNFLAMNIAPTASGKEHPQNCLWQLIKESGLINNFMSEPQSGTALLTGLKKANRVGLLSIDEVGRYLLNIQNKNSGGYQKEIIDYIIKSFSKANSMLVGKQYANDKLNPVIKILNPHLCVLGSSVREKIVQSCSSTDAIDGFLNRWILFETEKRPKRQEVERQEAPESILEKIRQINETKYVCTSDEEEPALKIVKFTPEAGAIYGDYCDLVDNLLDEAKYPLDALYSRSMEHVAKISLILCDNVNIRVQDVERAIDIVTESNKLIANFAGLIADNEQEKMNIKVLEIIRKQKTMTKMRLTGMTKFLNARQRNEILKDLVESGEILVEKNTSGGILYKSIA